MIFLFKKEKKIKLNKIFKINKMSETWIYILKCQNNKWYVGRTNDVKKRLQQHFDGEGSEWTRLHKPIDVVEKIKGDIYDEDKYTLKYMGKYGIENVRGAAYAQIVLDENDKSSIEKRLNGIMDKCFVCGGNHFVKDCHEKYKNKVEDKNIIINKNQLSTTIPQPKCQKIENLKLTKAKDGTLFFKLDNGDKIIFRLDNKTPTGIGMIVSGTTNIVNMNSSVKHTLETSNIAFDASKVAVSSETPSDEAEVEKSESEEEGEEEDKEIQIDVDDASEDDEDGENDVEDDDEDEIEEEEASEEEDEDDE